MDVQHEILHVSAKMTDAEVKKKFKGVPVTMQDAHIFVKGKTVTVVADGKVLLTLVSKFIPEQTHQEAFPDFRRVARNKPTRPAASGLSAKRVLRKNGTWGKTTRINAKHPRLMYAKDGTMGSFEDSVNKAEYCRTPIDVNELPTVYSYMTLVGEAYKKFAPNHYAAQLAAAQTVRPDWVASSLPYTTVASNWCYNTFVHKDGRDFKDGLGCLTAWYVGEANPVWLVFPKYGVAVLVEPGDVLLADVGNQLHANTQPARVRGYGKTNGRLSVIFYLRPGLAKCGTAAEESVRRETYLAKQKAKKADTPLQVVVAGNSADLSFN